MSTMSQYLNKQDLNSKNRSENDLIKVVWNINYLPQMDPS